MATRLLASGLLAASMLMAWLTINVALAARLLQAGIALSVVYVAYLAWRGHRAIRTAMGAASDAGETMGDGAGDRAPLPFVSIVVPARDEEAVIGAVVVELARQRYAADGAPRFEVIVVDDGSTDGTAAAAQPAGTGSSLVRITRREPESRLRTKGAALRHAMPLCRGTVIGVIDADSRLDADFVARAIRAWDRDPDAAALQAQRRPRNAAASWLTRAQAEEQLMDLASQSGRRATGGAAELRGNGMFVRRDALERVGGWSADALTEDLELSSRLSAAGEHVAIAPEAVVEEDAITRLGDLWRQRLRWAEGSLRRLMQHGPALLGGRLPLARKADFAAFSAEFLLPPLFAATIVASLATIPLPRPADWTVPLSLFLGYGLGSFLLATAGLSAAGQVGGPLLLARATRGALFLSHWLMVVPVALLRIALLPGQSEFVKTPRETTDR
jgi:1,2-diacylglycerol 3-beta-glucosyltransferase